MMTHFIKSHRNETGSALPIVVLVLVVLTLIGISAMTTSNIETQISGNDKFAKISFHEADGGTEAAISLIEENISCPIGFADPPNAGYHPTLSLNPTDDIVLGQMIIPDGNENFKANETTTFTRPNPLQRDTYFYYPDDVTAPPPAATQPHVNQTYNYEVKPGTGFALKQLGGYDGAGKSAASGGGSMFFDLPVQRVGTDDCDTCIRIQWEHRIGQEGTCSYF